MRITALLSLVALRAPSQLAAAKTNAERSLARMQSGTSRMPPAPAEAATADELAGLEQWLAAGGTSPYRVRADSHAALRRHHCARVGG